MAEVTSELIYEGLKALHARLGDVEQGLRETAGELRELRSDMQAQDLSLHAARTNLGIISEEFAGLEPRLARIERRIDIIDVPAT